MKLSITDLDPFDTKSSEFLRYLSEALDEFNKDDELESTEEELQNLKNQTSSNPFDPTPIVYQRKCYLCKQKKPAKHRSGYFVCDECFAKNDHSLLSMRALSKETLNNLPSNAKTTVSEGTFEKQGKESQIKSKFESHVNTDIYLQKAKDQKLI